MKVLLTSIESELMCEFDKEKYLKIIVFFLQAYLKMFDEVGIRLMIDVAQRKYCQRNTC